MTFIGIDPGVNGGIASIQCETSLRSGVVEMHSFRDMTLQDIVWLFSRLFGGGTRPVGQFVMLERVHAMPSTFRGCATSWTLAESYATIKTLLTVYEVPFEVVLPEKWQTVIGVRIKHTKGKKLEDKVDKKKINREKAQALFPKVSGITKDTADALLLAEYNRRTHK